MVSPRLAAVRRTACKMLHSSIICVRARNSKLFPAEGTMTADEFRSLALALPEARESSHMKHPDFRVRGKIFATLGPGERWGMVKLTPDQQRQFIVAEPAMFVPVKGAWGRQGCTTVQLESATGDRVRPAMIAAWRNAAPKVLAEEHEDLE
jgi:hypothetical protein